MDAMWFYDDAGEMEEYQAFRKRALHLENEHLKMRVAMRDMEAALRADPGNEDLRNWLKEIKKKLEELDRQAPWISSNVPVEVLLWGAPHG